MLTKTITLEFASKHSTPQCVERLLLGGKLPSMRPSGHYRANVSLAPVLRFLWC